MKIVGAWTLTGSRTVQHARLAGQASERPHWSPCVSANPLRLRLATLKRECTLLPLRLLAARGWRSQPFSMGHRRRRLRAVQGQREVLGRDTTPGATICPVKDFKRWGSDIAAAENAAGETPYSTGLTRKSRRRMATSGPMLPGVGPVGITEHHARPPPGEFSSQWLRV